MPQIIAGGGEAIGENSGKGGEGGDFDELLALSGGEPTSQTVELVGGCEVGHADHFGDGFPSQGGLAAYGVEDTMDENGVDGGVVDEVFIRELSSDSAVEVSLAAEFLNGK